MKTPTKAELYEKVKELQIRLDKNDHVYLSYNGFLWQGSGTNLFKFLENGYDVVCRNKELQDVCD